jgi:magnesium chelatase family protein
MAGLVGGGSGMPLPGEVSLASRGVLFLDEAAEFRRDALQAIRQPIEDGYVTLSRARYTVRYPSRFMLVMATNPCPCGWSGDHARGCQCAPGRVTSYMERLSGPLLDRIDLLVQVDRPDNSVLFAGAPESSARIRERVLSARRRQAARLAPYGLSLNAEIPPRHLYRAAAMTAAAKAALRSWQDRYAMSMRAAHRLMRVARTCADLDGSESVEDGHVISAGNFRWR